MKDSNRSKEQPAYESLEIDKQITKLKVSEINPRKAGKFFRVLFNNSPTGIYIVQNGKLKFVNPQFQKLTGYSKDELSGMDPLRLVFPGDRNMVRENAVKLLKGERNSPYEYRFVKKNGEIRWAVETVAPIQNFNRRVALGNIVDVTELKRAEEALTRSEQEKTNILETIFEHVVYQDKEMRILWANRATGESYGFTPGQLAGYHCYELWCQHDKPCPGCPVEKALKTDKPQEAEIDYPGGKTFIVRGYPVRDENGNVAGVVKVSLDITGRKLAKEEIRKLNQFLEVVIDNANVWLNVLDEKANVLIWNRAAETISGYFREEVVGHDKIWEWLYPDEKYRKEITEKAAAIIQKGEIVEDFETAIKTKGGEERIISWHSRNLVDDKGIPTGSVALGRDITGRKQMEQEMARLDQLNLVGEMAAGIGHEIRNPLTTVRGFLQFLGNKKDCAQYKEYYDLMIGELDRANSIITEFLSLAKNKAMNLNMQNLNSIVKTIHPLILADAMVSGKNVTIELEDAPDLLLDDKEIRQLILNLSRNGLEAMSAGGNLVIRTFADGEEVVLAVQDQGKGIKPDILKKIGTPFFTTKDNGTGLGLAVCYSIAARHKAAIKVETGPEGTIFFVHFRPYWGRQYETYK